MYGHEVNALFRVRAYYSQKVLSRDLEQIFIEIADSVVHRNSADHSGRFCDKLGAELVGLAVVGKIHYRLSAEADSHIYFSHFEVVVLSVARDAEVYVYLGAHTLAYALSRKRGVVHVCGNADLAGSHQRAYLFGGTVLFLGYSFHFGSDYAFLGCFHLRLIISHS